MANWGDSNVVDFCRECQKPLKVEEIYVWNGGAYCFICVNIVCNNGEYHR